jgi:hypothetical protein
MMDLHIEKLIRIMEIINGLDKWKLKYQLIIRIHHIEIYLKIRIINTLWLGKIVKSELV